MTEFCSFPKIARLNRETVITEKLDGTNAQILIAPITEMSNIADSAFGERIGVGHYVLCAGSRNRWLTPENDNFGFARWVHENARELVNLGPGRHFGEWYGQGIQRGYGLKEKRFALFNVSAWNPNPTGGVFNAETGEIIRCCHVVPLIWRGLFDQSDVIHSLDLLRSHGSFAAPGFRKPEGVVVYHTAAKQLFKVTLENDDKPKAKVLTQQEFSFA